jgi:hypothetical protein
MDDEKDVLRIVDDLENAERVSLIKSLTNIQKILLILDDIADICQELSKIEDTRQSFINERSTRVLRRCNV